MGRRTSASKAKIGLTAAVCCTAMCLATTDAAAMGLRGHDAAGRARERDGNITEGRVGRLTERNGSTATSQHSARRAQLEVIATSGDGKKKTAHYAVSLAAVGSSTRIRSANGDSEDEITIWKESEDKKGTLLNLRFHRSARRGRAHTSTTFSSAAYMRLRTKVTMGNAARADGSTLLVTVTLY